VYVSCDVGFGYTTEEDRLRDCSTWKVQVLGAVVVSRSSRGLQE
jgi:hypothetical protein